MAKLFSLSQIIMPPDKDGVEAVVQKGKVFDASPEQAHQFDALKAARPATGDEIKKAKADQDKADGVVTTAAEPASGTAATPSSGAAGDPNAKPK